MHQHQWFTSTHLVLGLSAPIARSRARILFFISVHTHSYFSVPVEQTTHLLEVLPKAGLVYSEKGNLSEVCLHACANTTALQNFVPPNIHICDKTVCIVLYTGLVQAENLAHQVRDS